MKSKTQPRPANSKSSPAQNQPAPATPMPTIKPFHPRRALLIALLIGFIIWVAILLTVYFKTVRPLRPH